MTALSLLQGPLSQELSSKMLGQKTEAEGRTKEREAEIALLQLELASLQQQQQHSQHGDDSMLSMHSIADPAAQRYRDHSRGMEMKALLDDKRKLQVLFLLWQYSMQAFAKVLALRRHWILSHREI